MGKTPSLRLALLAILFAPLLALVAEAQLASLELGEVYRIVNKSTSAKPSLTPNSNNVATAAATIANGADGYLSQYWYVYRVNTAGTNPNYTLRNVGNGKFLKGAGQDSQWTLTDAATSACNLYFLTVGTYNTFSQTDSNDGKDKMYAAESKSYNVVGWSTDAEATSWTFTETTNAAVTAAIALLPQKLALINKITEAKSYINLQVLKPTANGYLFCNDPYLGNGDDYSPQDKGYNLIDCNTATYFHSNWDKNNKKPLEDQWIRVTYPTGISTFTFNYTNRNTPWNTTSHIKTMVVEGSVDDVTYTPIKEYTDDDHLPNKALGTYSSGTLGSADKVYKYLRFRVTSTHQNANFYNLAELSVTRKNISSAESDAIATLRSAITTAEVALSRATTAEAYTEATSALDEAINTYNGAMESVYAAQPAKELLKEKIKQLNNEYVGNNGFLESVSGINYTWQSKYDADKSSLTGLVDRMRIELDAANATCEGTDLDAYNTHITQCEALTLEAQEVKFYNYSLPVKMSTAEATYYYSIHEKGTEEDIVWQYNTSTKDDSWTDGYCANKVKLLTISAEEKENGVEIGNPRHAFYFKRGAKIPEVYIYNAYDGYRLCAISTDFAEGAGKAKFLKESTESEANSDFDNASCRSWEIIANGGCYNLRGIATDENNTSRLYAAHVASHTNNLGFSTDASADIAQFSFKINKYPNKTCPYYVLRNYCNTQLKMSLYVTTTNELGFPAAITLKDEQHTVTDNFNEAFHAAYFAFDLNVPSSDADIQRIYERLKKYNEALTMYVPTEATYYTFNSGLSALTAHSLAIDPTTCAMSATTGMVKTVGNKTTEHTQALWLLTPVPGKVNTFTMQNVHTGLYVQSFAGGTLSMGKNAANIVLASRDLTTGQFAFTATDASTYVLKAAEADGAVSAAEQAVSPAANAADCWTATKVTDLTTVQHPVSITPYGKAGFYSSHEVTLPAGVQAWYMEDGSTKVDDDRVTRITMTKVTPEDNGTTILPKETAVLLVTPTAPDETTTYNLTYNNTNAKAAITDNQLSGVAYSQPVAGGERTTCYKFGVVDGLAALYPMYQEYNAAGELTNPGTDDGGYIKASANKIYLKILSSGASRLEFRFTDPTTGIEQIITDANATTPADTYYDLQGRRIQGRPAGGIYIVNGVKRIIRR